MYSPLVLEARNPKLSHQVPWRNYLFFLPHFWQWLVSLHAPSWTSPHLPCVFPHGVLVEKVYSVHNNDVPQVMGPQDRVTPFHPHFHRVLSRSIDVCQRGPQNASLT